MLRARGGPTFLLFLWPAVAACSACWSCSSPPMPLAEVLELPRAPLVPERFAGAPGLLRGFDPGDPAAADSIPETALFGLELDARGRIQRWLLRLEAREPTAAAPTICQRINAPGGSLAYESRRRRLQVTLFDGAGRKLRDSMVDVPWDFLATGFVRSCDLAQQLADTQAVEVDYRGKRLARAEAARHMYGGFATLTAFLRIIKENELLSSVLWQVIDRPSMFSILFHGGVNLSLKAQLTTAAALPDPDLRGRLSKLPGYRTTLQLQANGSPVLNAIMWVTEPQSPYRLSGGILVIEGFRPSDARVRFRMELLAAVRGLAPLQRESLRTARHLSK